MTSRKRKADDDLAEATFNTSSSSPSTSPPTSSRAAVNRARQLKKPRTDLSGRPLALPRLLETLSPADLRGVLKSICDRHPEIGVEIASNAPRPSASSALYILSNYESSFRDSFPYGDRPSSDYAYNRVRQPLMELLEALKDFTPQFLPPHENQPAVSLAFLDGATNLIHRLPEWDSFQNHRHKLEAYEEIARAWSLVISEAAKKGGGIQLQHVGWDQKLARHNDLSGGRMSDALTELRSSLGWIEGAATGHPPSQDVMSIRDQLFSNNYGSSNPIRVGPW